ncbi:carbonic anhydrase [Niallia endozanthoxylica]|uniref:Carbonic anhydrase n=1 Tax=Niallia endozanthoxylica TaxID=2036016 RepID=A0A5J5HJS2_9BACI|nr:hypothetical protein [Niallia endozanthoxylica]KAA9021036.1 hypothetical protein F4V44_17995 [Niallia endozanthoxylica]
MYLKENKKVLFVVGREKEIDFHDVKHRYQVRPEEMILLESDELDKIEPFGELMREILLHVYQKNIEEIVIVDTNKDRKDSEDILGRIGESIDPHQSMSTLHYLFTHCNPEFSNTTIMEWFEGNHSFIGTNQKSVEVIRSHPLMPSSVKVMELRIGHENETQHEVDIF